MFKLLAGIFLYTTGWEIVGTKVSDRRVVVGAPHTSNWDLMLTLVIKFSRGDEMSWLVKHTLFWWPLGPILRALGGIPIRRDRSEHVVDQLVRAFDETETLTLAITPEGTRSHTPYWKSGFYHIAKAAGVPIQLGFVDYARRRAGYGPAFIPSDDVRADMDKIRAFYADVGARHPDQASEIRLREEDESIAEAAGVDQT